MSTGLSSSPPTLPVPRQPSPLSFSSVPAQEPPSPIPLSPALPSTEPVASSSRFPHAVPLSSPMTGHVPARTAVPVEPLPDSLLLRSTFASLDHSATTLKRLTKSVLASTTAYLALLDQLEKVEDELFSGLGELGGWLEGGYGIPGIMWDDDGKGRVKGVRAIRRERRKREREQVEALVDHGLKAVKGELKRTGVAGGGAQTRFEATAKQFYHQTSIYLAPQPTAQTSAVNSQPTQSSHTVSAEAAQAGRAAQFDIARYAHHSTLLYAVPPSSIPCVDLLVGLYGWIGELLGETPGIRGVDDVVPTMKSADEALLSRSSNTTSTSPTEIIKGELSSSLAHLSHIRADLLQAWAARHLQTTHLESLAQSVDQHPPPPSPSDSLLPVSSNGIEHKRPHRKIQKIQRSVGGRLRDFLTTSTSTTNLSTLAETRSGRMSLDASHHHHSAPRSKAIPEEGVLPSQSIVEKRPALPSRHSLHVTNREYIAPLSRQLDISLGLDSNITSRDNLVGNLSIRTGNEDEQRVEVGRKKEGVLWGAGTWEGLSRTGGKSKWEKFWVVLDHCRIYEYRDNGLDRPESAYAVIDLKFASVREGRGTDRRFVFEIVTPTQGRRLYQATSETEMKQWLYAICNAIESSINGTSSVRTFDASKLRTPSGALDDYALPTRSKLALLGAGAGARRSMPPPPRDRQRKTSLKDVLRQSADLASEKWSSVVNAQGRPQIGRGGSSGKSSIEDGNMTPTATPLSSRKMERPTPNRSKTSESSSPSIDRVSWYEENADGEIEKRVLEMAGLGIGLGFSPAGSGSGRRVHSEGVPKGKTEDGEGAEISRSRSAEQPTVALISPTHFPHVSPTLVSSPVLPALVSPPDVPVVDMQLLRAVADLPHNMRCADCGRGMKSSRWATLSLRENPMVLFICIRCCGLHRGLGTHISKPRSVDLDKWTRESIMLATEWGNQRGNAVWEATRSDSVELNDGDMADFIKAKYVEGRWLADEDKQRYGLA